MLVKTPTSSEIKPSLVKIFLAGSIEMGSAEDWQQYVIDELSKITNHDCIEIYNPRRESWDSSWIQSQQEDNFNEQVNWELNNLEAADLILFYFSPETKSPITLFELGRYAKPHNTIVCCPDKFYRKGNVEIFCTRESIVLYDNLDKAIGALKTKIKQNGK